ncbi:glycosyltransferase [Nitrosococcus wardiae]|uniref:Glycosyltransferase family 1 protein n=1 Tax=Nitrosococcus wardiae TaxID=1814290 RepID=A0A4P7BWN0_9GAMM|nr:glycosyltransferase [Nitrosococcus wardiae]QBQ54498.1 glycosyltransferase family 1 protein [Nitrosococcus wardiae]
MKILHIFHNYNIDNGVERTSLTLLKALRPLGVHSHAVIPSLGDVTRELEKENFPYHVLPLHCCGSSVWRAQIRFLSNADERINKLEALLRTEKFDVVHLNTGHLLDGAIASARVGVPVIWHIHAPFEVDFQRYKDLIGEEGYAWILGGLGSQVIAVSDDVRESLAGYLRPELIQTVYNGIDVEELIERSNKKGTDIYQELDLPENAKLILGVGRISEQKNFSAFVHVAESVLKQRADVFFAIVGPQQDKQLAAALENQIQTAKLSDRVFLLGARQDVPQLLKQSDAFLSTAAYEGQGLAALEAMALERPVVAMACVGLRECIRNEVDGILVPPGDIEATAFAILQVLKDSSLALRLGAAGRLAVHQRFSNRLYAQKFIEIAQQAILDGPSRVDFGALAAIHGLLHQITLARSRIVELDRPSWRYRYARVLLNKGSILLHKLKEKLI